MMLCPIFTIAARVMTLDGFLMYARSRGPKTSPNTSFLVFAQREIVKLENPHYYNNTRKNSYLSNRLT